MNARLTKIPTWRRLWKPHATLGMSSGLNASNLVLYVSRLFWYSFIWTAHVPITHLRNALVLKPLGSTADTTWSNLGPLLRVPCFKRSMVKWCAMHILHLGCDLWIAGSTLKVLLLNTDFWGQGSDNVRLHTAWLEFKQFCRDYKWAWPSSSYLKL